MNKQYQEGKSLKVEECFTDIQKLQIPKRVL